MKKIIYAAVTVILWVINDEAVSLAALCVLAICGIFAFAKEQIKEEKENRNA